MKLCGRRNKTAAQPCPVESRQNSGDECSFTELSVGGGLACGFTEG